MDRRKHSDVIETIVRAIVFDGEKKRVLFCSPADKKYYYLPGGHIEWGETAVAALKREFGEETGIKIAAEGNLVFVGVDENIFAQNGVSKHEINLYFHADIGPLPEEISAKEKHISFSWISLDQVSGAKIYPASVKRRIVQFAEKGEVTWG